MARRSCPDCGDEYPGGVRSTGLCGACKELGRVLVALHGTCRECPADAAEKRRRIPRYARLAAAGQPLFGGLTDERLEQPG